VRHRGQHASAVAQVTREAGLHGVERAGGTHYFKWPLLFQRRAINVLSQFLGGIGQRIERAHGPTHRNQRYEHDRRQQ